MTTAQKDVPAVTEGCICTFEDGERARVLVEPDERGWALIEIVHASDEPLLAEQFPVGHIGTQLVHQTLVKIDPPDPAEPPTPRLGDPARVQALRKAAALAISRCLQCCDSTDHCPRCAPLFAALNTTR
jgi:hypothetical protein